MKLAALFEYTFPKIKYRRVSKLPQQYHHGDPQAAYHDDEYQPGVVKRGAKHMGTGHFSSTYQNPQKSPEDVRKVSREAGYNEVDGFFYYIKHLEDHDDSGNPYFPRFRDITVYQGPPDPIDPDDEGNVVYTANMETLVPVGSMQRDQRIALYKRIFGKNWEKYVGKSPSMITTYAVDAYRSGHDRSQILDDIVEDDFKKAAEYIAQVAEVENLDIDIHSDNVMLRRTPYGMQLVITDPLGFSN